jgi:hypothetical protein
MNDGSLLFVAPNSYVLRNWLSSGLADLCRERLDLRPVFVSPFEDADFQSPAAVRYRNHPVPIGRLRGKDVPTAFPAHLWAVNHLRLRAYAQDVVNGGGQTMLLAERRDAVNAAVAAGRRLLPRGSARRRAARWLVDRLPARHAPIGSLLDEIRPRGVLCGTPGFMPLDQLVGIEARRRAIPVHCVVNSWDNLSSRGPFLYRPDSLLVWNRHMATAARDIHEYPAEQTHVVGALQFQPYGDPPTAQERATLRARLGLEPREPYFLYLTGAQTAEYEAEDLDALLRALARTRLADVVPVVRVHPQADEAPFRTLGPRVRLDVPPKFGARGSGGDRFGVTEIRSMGTLLAGADVVFASCGTTALLEAAIFDRPMIQLRWMESVPHRNRDEVELVHRYQRFEHVRPFDATGCRLFSDSPDDLPERLQELDARAEELMERRARAVAELAPPPQSEVPARVAGVLATLLRGPAVVRS